MLFLHVLSKSFGGDCHNLSAFGNSGIKRIVVMCLSCVGIGKHGIEAADRK